MTSELADVRLAIETIHEAFVRQFNAGAVEPMVTGCYTTDAYFVPPNRPPAQGHHQIAEFFRGVVAPGQIEHTPLECLRVETSGDLAYAIGRYRLIVCAAEGPPTADTGSFLAVWRRQADGSWRCAAEMVSNDPVAS